MGEKSRRASEGALLERRPSPRRDRRGVRLPGEDPAVRSAFPSACAAPRAGQTVQPYVWWGRGVVDPSTISHERTEHVMKEAKVQLHQHYPRTVTLANNSSVTLRLMTPFDGERILAFARSL